jgi:hypothetical protein
VHAFDGAVLATAVSTRRARAWAIEEGKRFGAEQHPKGAGSEFALA